MKLCNLVSWCAASPPELAGILCMCALQVSLGQHYRPPCCCGICNIWLQFCKVNDDGRVCHAFLCVGRLRHSLAGTTTYMMLQFDVAKTCKRLCVRLSLQVAV